MIHPNYNIKLFNIFFKIVSEEYGPETLILIFFKYFIAGKIFSLFSLSKLSQCGFNPVTAILGAIFKTFYKNYLSS